MVLQKLIACLLTILATTVYAVDASGEPPNILWIYVDDMSDWVGCYGHSAVETPHIDSLAAGGVKFDRAYMPSPVCSTTRSALITGTMQVPSPLLYDGLLYYNQSNQAILRCLDSLSGEVLFGPERLSQVRNIYASPVGASGRIYVTGRNGTTLVLERSRDFKVLATNKLDERFDASPALAGDQLFLRGAKYLYCIESN